MKLYIAVLDQVPDHMVPVLVAHAVLGAHLKWYGYHWEGYTGESLEARNNYNDWLRDSFRKVVLKVNKKEFEKIKLLENVYLAHENSTLGGEKSCVVVCPRDGIYPNVIKFAKMWKPNE